MSDLTVMMYEFLQLQIERCRQYRFKKKVKQMELFKNVLIQGARKFVATIIINQRLAITILPVQPDEASPEVIRPEDIITFDSGVDHVTINLVNEQRLDPFMIFTSPDESNRFVVCLRYFLDYSNPEGNGNSNQVDQTEPNQGS